MSRHKPDDSERMKWQNPLDILTDIGVGPGTYFVDAGCGNGFFTLPAARIAGPDGHVWGFDINPAKINSLKEEATAEGITNLSLAVGRAEETVVCRNCADFVFYGVVLHDFFNLSKVLANAQKMLKPGGKLVNLDWKKEEMQYGPAFEKRFSIKEASGIITAAGFTIEDINEKGLYHYIITATP